MTSYLLDSNVWVALSLEAHVHHIMAQAWLRSVDQSASLLFCRSTQQSFLRLLSTPTIPGLMGLQPLTNADAWSVYETITADERVALRLEEPTGIDAHWRRFASRPTASTKLWMDAYLAAFAMAGGLTMVTTDRAFRQFDGLDLVVLGEDPDKPR